MTPARLSLTVWFLAALWLPTTVAAEDAAPAEAAPYVIETWNTDRGLFQNVVISVAQSGDGYLWLAYHHGWVSRFDGVRFEHYTPADTPALAGSSVHRVFTDSNGDLWASIVGGGLARRQNGEFRRLREGSVSVAGSLDLVSDLVYCNRGQAVFGATTGGTSHSLLRGWWREATNLVWQTVPLTKSTTPSYAVSGDGRVFYRADLDQVGYWHQDGLQLIPSRQLPAGRVNCLSADAQGQVWAGTETGLALWREARFEDMTPTNGEPQVAVAKMEYAGDGGLWVLSRDRLRKCQGRQWIAEADASKLPPISRTRTLRLYGDRNGGVWLMDRHLGLWAVSSRGEVWKLGEREGLPPGLIECWFQDREGSVWLGLYGGGLARVRPRQFQVVSPVAAGPGLIMSSVCQDASGRIWLGSVGGGVWQQQNGRFERVELPPTTEPLHNIKLWPAAGGGVWIGTEGNGAWRWREGELERPFPPEAIGKSVLAGLTERAGVAWIANEYGPYRFANDQLEKLGTTDLITDDRFLALAEDVHGGIWIGTINGRLWRYSGGRFEKFELPADEPRFRFWSLLTDADDNVWVGTMGGGLLRWRDGRLSRISEAHGLPNTTILQLLDDDRGRLWAGTRSGLFSVAKSELHEVLDGRRTPVNCRSFTAADGLPSSEFTGEHQPACWKARDGRLWFTTLKGAVAFHPQDLRPNPMPPRVRIEEVRLDGREWAGGRRPLPLGTMDVQPGGHYLEFRFTAPTSVSPERIRFRWRLEGLESDWREAVNERVVQYSFLPVGHYVFQVSACNSDGVWNETPAAFAFEILPHFWQTRTFQFGGPVAGTALTSLLLAAVLRRRHRAQMERLEQQRLLEQERARLAHERLAHQRELEGERARIAQDLHDDLGASLSQMAWLSETTSQSAAVSTESRGPLSQITEKSREMVRAIDEIVWTLNPRNDSLDQLATYVCQFAEQFFRNTPTRCRFDVADSLPGEMLKSDIRHHLFLLLKEVMQNVAKHAAAGEVWVRIQAHDGRAVFEVADDGCGFNPEMPYAGDGLNNMKRRAAAMRATVDVRAAPGQGTRVRVELPLTPPPEQNHPSG